MASRRAVGEGSVYRRRDKEGKEIKDAWVAQITVGGKRKTFTGKTRKEATAKQDEYKKSAEFLLPTAGAEMKLEDFMTEWMASVKRRTLKDTSYDKQSPLYPKDLLQDILLGLHSMCEGAESKFFNGHTNVTSDRFIVFGVKGLLQASQNVKNALLFNVLSYMSDRLLTVGNTVAALDELYLFLTNKTVIEYIRSFMKRVRKKESAVILSSQNLEDFALPGIAELTKPLFSIPVHQFLFNAGSVDSKFYMDTLQLEESEYKLIKYPQQGVCLYKCGNERYNLAVHAPEYKETLFGTAGGR